MFWTGFTATAIENCSTTQTRMSSANGTPTVTRKRFGYKSELAAESLQGRLQKRNLVNDMLSDPLGVLDDHRMYKLSILFPLSSCQFFD
ncbi:hypothetical protein HK096_005157 [Nowakowskiella sp. JEL0078]|nr:hypothetical protein HK096_005157 [Nowakowskiella sp. JEL0078]